MQTWTNVSWKGFGELALGELALARVNGDYALIFKYDGGAGIVNGPAHMKGVWFPASGNLRCISLGSDWFLDVALDEHFFPENPHAYNANTDLFFGPTGFAWKFKPHTNMNDEIFVSLAGGEPTYHLAQHSAPVLHWSIWESEKHRLAGGTEPLVRFPPVAA